MIIIHATQSNDNAQQTITHKRETTHTKDTKTNNQAKHNTTNIGGKKQTRTPPNNNTYNLTQNKHKQQHTHITTHK